MIELPALLKRFITGLLAGAIPSDYVQPDALVNLTSQARDWSLTSRARDFSLTSQARDFSLTSQSRDT